MCKSEYKLIRKMQWDGDVLKVQDTMHDVLREAKQAAEDAMTGEVLSHFECDFSDFREYMRDKIKWEQKQRAAMPRWISVTKRPPEPGMIVWDGMRDPFTADEIVTREIEGETFYYPEKYLVNAPIIAWMPRPEPPKGEDNAEGHDEDDDEQTSEDI